MTTDRPSLISLFAGAGGLDLGLEKAGFTTLFATDIDGNACESLVQNQRLSTLGPAEFDSWFEEQLSQRCYRSLTGKERERLGARLRLGAGNSALLQDATITCDDVRNIRGDEVLDAVGATRGEIDLIAGGPPCQPFSRAGKRETVTVKDGQLFIEFVRLVEEIQPRFFLFENVKGLGQSKTEVWWAECEVCGEKQFPAFSIPRVLPTNGAPHCSRCESSRTAWRVAKKPGGSLELIVEEFERISYACKSTLLDAADFGLPQHRQRLFIIGSRDGENVDWPIPDFGDANAPARPSLFADDRIMRPRRTMREELWPDGHPDFGELSEDAVLWVKNVVRPHDEPVTWSLDRPSPTIGAHQAAKLALAPSGVPEAQIYRQQWHTIGRRQGQTPPVPVEHAYLSDEELLKLQGFPESWYLFGTRMQRAFQIGNAVPPPLASEVGDSLFQTVVGLGEPVEA
jgi:DNA (cytosine-5)-methyltransferase 1